MSSPRDNLLQQASKSAPLRCPQAEASRRPEGPPQDLDECEALTTLTSAVQALGHTPQHPSADRLVHTLQQLARACRRRVLVARAETRPAGDGAELAAWDPPALARAEQLADRAEQVAQWARERVLGGDPGLLDQWLARQRLRQAGSSQAGRPAAHPGPPPQAC